MALPARLLIGAAVGLAVGGWVAAGRPVATAQQTEKATSRSPNPDLEWQGVASCASGPCHNGNGPRGSKGSEYTTWVSYDPHARAYAALLNSRSRLIEKNFRKLKDLKDAHAENDAVCLACHASTPAKRKPEVSVLDGVSCESCHGPAEKWLTTHYLPEWQSKSAAEKIKEGMRPTKDLAYRAQACAECHVGTPEKEVNHDLIAAGHPRLNFEFGAYLANMPKHWDEHKEKEMDRSFEARAWAIGQVVSAAAAFELLHHRAADSKLPWPEFAEYDCFSCHHELKAQSWRQERGYSGRKPGALPYSTWYTCLLPETREGAEARQALERQLRDLAQEMEKPLPDRNAVQERARALAETCTNSLKAVGSQDLSLTTINRAMEALARDERQIARQSWDGDAQVYLALAAFYNARTDLDPKTRDSDFRESLRTRVQRLQFSKGLDSPRQFVPALLPVPPASGSR